MCGFFPAKECLHSAVLYCFEITVLTLNLLPAMSLWVSFPFSASLIPDMSWRLCLLSGYTPLPYLRVVARRTFFFRPHCMLVLGGGANCPVICHKIVKSEVNNVKKCRITGNIMFLFLGFFSCLSLRTAVVVITAHTSDYLVHCYFSFSVDPEVPFLRCIVI